MNSCGLSPILCIVGNHKGDVLEKTKDIHQCTIKSSHVSATFTLHVLKIPYFVYDAARVLFFSVLLCESNIVFVCKTEWHGK